MVIFNCTIRPVLHERRLDGRANSSQHPTRGRSLARRFRGSHSATLCVAPPARKGRARVSSKSVGRLACECSETQISAVGTSAHFFVFATACWQQRTLSAGAHAVECTFAREPPGAFGVLCKALTRVSRLG